jgi:hypothetical protein
MPVIGPSKSNGVRSHEGDGHDSGCRRNWGACQRELGRQIEIHNIGIGEQVPGLPDLSNAVLTSLEMYDSPIAMREAGTRYGVHGTSLQTWAHETFAQTAVLERPA